MQAGPSRRCVTAVDQAVGDAIGEVLCVGIRSHIDEGQDREGIYRLSVPAEGAEVNGGGYGSHQQHQREYHIQLVAFDLAEEWLCPLNRGAMLRRCRDLAHLPRRLVALSLRLPVAFLFFNYDAPTSLERSKT